MTDGQLTDGLTNRVVSDYYKAPILKRETIMKRRRELGENAGIVDGKFKIFQDMDP